LKGRQEAGLSREDRRDLFVDDNAPLETNQFFNLEGKGTAGGFSQEQVRFQDANDKGMRGQPINDTRPDLRDEAIAPSNLLYTT